MVRRVLKDNKVPGTSVGAKVAEALARAAGSAAGVLGESQAGLCERSGAWLDQGGLNGRNFSKRKRENRVTQRLFQELSTTAVSSCTPIPSAVGLWTPHKQPQHPPGAWWAHTPVSSLDAHTTNPGWARTVISDPAAPVHRPTARDQYAPRSAARLSGHTDPKYPGGCAPRLADWLPTPETLSGHALWSVALLPRSTGPTLGSVHNPINGLAALRWPHLKYQVWTSPT